MAARKRGSRSQKRLGDPGQLNLFDASQQRGEKRTKPAAALRTRTKRIVAASIERPVILSPRDAAAYLGVAVSTLKSWRAKNIGPLWQRRGARLVFYFPADLDAFLRRGARGTNKL